VHTLEDTLPWGVDRIDAELVWNGAEDGCDVIGGRNAGTGVNVAIIDTGIDDDHPDLSVAGGINYGEGSPSEWDDDNGHGTHCAGIVAALDNEMGVVGVAPEADLYAVKVLNSNGEGYVSDVIAGIQWSVNNGMAVISMSLGSDFGSISLKKACDNAYGVSIKSTYLGGGYATASGTSMACPHVAGTAALVIAAGGDVRQCLRDTADDLGAAGKDNLYGFGLVDAEEAALGDITPPAQVTGLIVTTVSSSQLNLNWNANSETDLDYYNVYRSTTSGSSYALIASPTTTSYSDTGLETSTSYYYTVSAVDSSDNEGTASVKVSGTTSEAGGDVMNVSAISMWYDTRGPNYFIYTEVTIVDGNSVSVPEATVYLETTLQGGSTVSDSGSTNGEGSVTFKRRSKQAGTYTSTVTNVEKSDWIYDPTVNVKTSETQEVS
jgi:hypothetical protein